jgi:ABC-2 type transport system permease protein
MQAQFRAVAQMRWRMLVNSLRSRRGGFDLGARIVTRTFFSIIGLGIGAGLCFSAFQIASHSSLRLIAALLWPVFIVWQFAPIAVASFQENPDLGIFLRFPVSFRAYSLLYILFGLFDIGSLIGEIALLGIFIGASIARPTLILWFAVSFALFAAFNILLTRMIFAWIDRWLAQRKTREILGVVFLFIMLGAQLLNPAFYPHHEHRHQVQTNHDAGRQARLNGVSSPDLQRVIYIAEHVQNGLPPGLAANAVYSAHQGRPIAVAIDLSALLLFAAAAGYGLGIRLGAEYRGESLGEAPPSTAGGVRAIQSSSLLQGSGPIAAVIEKEIRYLMRSGVMLYGFLAPLFIVFVFSGRSHLTHAQGFGGQFALPIGVAYSFLGLTRFVYNNLGAEGSGIQLYFLSPTPFGKVMLAKNIVHCAIFLIELTLVCAIILMRTGRPDPEMLALTLCWLLFAIPTQLTIGNVLSITMPYRLRMTGMAREQGSTGNVLLSMLVQLIVFAVGAGVYLLFARAGHADFAPPALLVLAIASVLAWWRVLANSGSMAEQRKDILIAALYRAQ